MGGIFGFGARFGVLEGFVDEVWAGGCAGGGLIS
jgi:hypothetical protein